jgi:PAT family beta-lactamase induction signal transducer AmpG
MPERPSPLRSRLFWVGVLYFAQGLPLGIFLDLLPVYFRQQGVDLRQIGVLGLLGLAWTLKFLWAPAVDAWRGHRRWMQVANLVMAGCVLALTGLTPGEPALWLALGLFALASASNDIAIDGYTVEKVPREELGLANGVRIALYRVGMLTAGALLMASGHIGWPATFTAAAGLLVLLALVCRTAPAEAPRVAPRPRAADIAGLLRLPRVRYAGLALIALLAWLIGRQMQWLGHYGDGLLAAAGAALLVAAAWQPARAGASLPAAPFASLLGRPDMLAVLAFALTFKLGDAAMGFMVKPFWVDAGFSASEIGLVSVNAGLLLSVLGGVLGGVATHRLGVFTALWSLGLLQAVSNLGYAYAAHVDATGDVSGAVLYSASVAESLTGGLGTGAFLAFLMAVVDRRQAASEYALLSSLFALSRSLAGFASGFGAELMGYRDYFLLTFLLCFPAYALLPAVRRALLADNTASPTEELR